MSVLWWLRNALLENGFEMISADEQWINCLTQTHTKQNQSNPACLALRSMLPSSGSLFYADVWKYLSGHQRPLSLPHHSTYDTSPRPAQPYGGCVTKDSWTNAQLWDPTMGLWAPWALRVLWPLSGHVRVSSEGPRGTTLGDKKGSGCEGAGLTCLTLPLSTPGAGVYFPSLPHTDRNIDLVSCNIHLIICNVKSEQTDLIPHFPHVFLWCC